MPNVRNKSREEYLWSVRAKLRNWNYDYGKGQCVRVVIKGKTQYKFTKSWAWLRGRVALVSLCGVREPVRIDDCTPCTYPGQAYEGESWD